VEVKYLIKYRQQFLTISVQKKLSELMAFKLGSRPNTYDAYDSVRNWIQKDLRRSLRCLQGESFEKNASQLANERLFDALVEPDTRRKWYRWSAEKTLPEPDSIQN
jgi:hypothetical protein